MLIFYIEYKRFVDEEKIQKVVLKPKLFLNVPSGCFQQNFEEAMYTIVKENTITIIFINFYSFIIGFIYFKKSSVGKATTSY